jgi:small nuclear ribonucleoprotein (snRNP)-like protein
MGKTQITVIEPSEVEEVQQLLGVERELQALIQSNPEFYGKLMTLSQHRNELLSNAEKRIRGMGVTCGPFVKLSESTKIDAEKLFEEMGETNFKEVGGYTETVVDYKVDRTRVLSYLESGVIPKEVADVCITTEQRYKKPNPYLLP